MAHLGILTALIPEAACLLGKPGINTPIRLSANATLYVCGLGEARARQGAERLLAEGAEALICLGTAGALDSDIAAGDVIVPDRILYGDSRRNETHNEWRAAVVHALSAQGLPVHVGSLLHADKVVRHAREKQALHRATGAIAVDMESSAMVELANSRGIPSLVVRVVVDGAGLTIPEWVLTHSDAYGRVRPGGLLLALLGRPARLPRLVELAGAYRTASRRLRRLGENLEALAPPSR